MAGTTGPYTEIDYRADDRVATITLSRPDQLNAFTQVMRDELIDAFDRPPRTRSPGRSPTTPPPSRSRPHGS